MKRIFLFSFLFFWVGQSSCLYDKGKEVINVLPEDRSFVEKFSAPEVVSKELDEFFKQSRKNNHLQMGKKRLLNRLKDFGCKLIAINKSRGFAVLKLPGINNYLIKVRFKRRKRIINSDKSVSCMVNVGRVFAAHKMRKYIEKNNLHHVVVPKKYLYHVPRTPEDLNDLNYVVVVERFKIKKEKDESKTLVFNWERFNNLHPSVHREIAKVICCTGYADAKFNNIVFGKKYGSNGDLKVVFIDTEPTAECLVEDFHFWDFREWIHYSVAIDIPEKFMNCDVVNVHEWMNQCMDELSGYSRRLLFLMIQVYKYLAVKERAEDFISLKKGMKFAKLMIILRRGIYLLQNCVVSKGDFLTKENKIFDLYESILLEKIDALMGELEVSFDYKKA